MNIRTEKVQVPVEGDKPMPAHVAAPESGGPYPAVIVIEEIFGVNPHIREVADRVAREGYVAIAPDVHHRDLHGKELGYDQAGMQEGMQLIPKLTEKNVRADLAGTLAYLRARKDVKGDKIGCMGFCIGGHLAYLAAATTDVKATASFYGGGIATFSPGGGEPTVNRTKNIKGKILCLFGGKDTMIPKPHVDAIRAELEKHHVPHEIVVYPEAGHAFFRDVDPKAHHAPSAADAWTRVKKLFAEM
jgi:carboxymethylenebutenolidase